MELIKQKTTQVVILILGIIATVILLRAYGHDRDVFQAEIESQKQLARYIATLRLEVTDEIAKIKEQTGDVRPKDVALKVEELTKHFDGEMQNIHDELQRNTDDRFRGEDMDDHIKDRIEPLERKVSELEEKVNN